jgi:hypothetical protein
MASKDYVPRTQSGFKNWQQTVLQFVTTNAAVWAIDAATVQGLTDRNTAFNSLYDMVSNRKTCTLQQVAAYNEMRKDYISFLRQLVQGSLVNNPLVAYDDKVAMGLNIRPDYKPERPAITSFVDISINAVGGGTMEFVCKDSTDGRSKRPANADGLLLEITVVMGQNTDTDTGEVTDITEQFTIPSSRTRVRHTFTAAQRGKPFSVVGKWYNNTDHSKDGNWGNSVSGFVG